jgi:uncharacterized protein
MTPATLFAVHALDAQGALRSDHYEEHKAHLRRTGEYGVKLVIGGPLLSDDGQTALGSLMVFEAPDRASVERFNLDDPFRKNGVWSKVHVARFDRKT